jgi:rubredoxin
MWKSIICWLTLGATVANAFSVPNTKPAVVVVAAAGRYSRSRVTATTTFLRSSPSPEDNSPAATTVSKDDAVVDPMEEAMEEMDEQTRKAMEKARRADELRAQEVFMKKSTGKHKCTNCDWEYDEAIGDSKMIGGTIAPGTAFAELPSNWRCPVCRASKDSFVEVVEEIPGFEVNQGYGFGTNSWTSGQKNLAVFGGLGLFFLLFLSGYAMN